MSAKGNGVDLHYSVSSQVYKQCVNKHVSHIALMFTKYVLFCNAMASIFAEHVFYSVYGFKLC